MDDIDLLKMAAKAAGFGTKNGGTCWTESEYPRNSGKHGALWNYIGHMDTAELWNPLSDDGDALRLAIVLQLDVSFNDEGMCVYASDLAYEPYMRNSDEFSATRRAIVRAAAAIGEQIP